MIRLGIPQSALAFIFIGRGSRTPLQVGLYKNFQNKMKPTRITTGQTGQTGRPLNCQNWLSTPMKRLQANNGNVAVDHGSPSEWLKSTPLRCSHRVSREKRDACRAAASSGHFSKKKPPSSHKSLQNPSCQDCVATTFITFPFRPSK